MKDLPRALFSFYISLEQVSLPENSIVFLPSGTETIDHGFRNGIPLLSLCPPLIKDDDFFEVLKKVGEIIQEHYPHLTKEYQQIYAALPTDKINRELFVAKVFTPGENLLNCLPEDISPETFGFLLRHAAKPFMRKLGEITAGLYNFEEWLRGTCPLCGGRPSLSLLEKEKGRRYLYCGLCEIKWRFQRLGCPYCQKEESQFFVIEGEEKYRVYYCENCRGYLKTIDERKAAGEINLFWEDIRTVYLDMLALREGYVNLPVKTSGIPE